MMISSDRITAHTGSNFRRYRAQILSASCGQNQIATLRDKSMVNLGLDLTLSANLALFIPAPPLESPLGNPTDTFPTSFFLFLPDTLARQRGALQPVLLHPRLGATNDFLSFLFILGAIYSFPIPTYHTSLSSPPYPCHPPQSSEPVLSGLASLLAHAIQTHFEHPSSMSLCNLESAQVGPWKTLYSIPFWRMMRQR
jgi:hypothetical protein